MVKTICALLLAPLVTAIFLPTGHTNTSSVILMTSAPALTTAAMATATAPVSCDVSYCSNGTSYCHFWGGVSTWNPTGPQPGEMRTTLGPCRVFMAKPTRV